MLAIAMVMICFSFSNITCSKMAVLPKGLVSHRRVIVGYSFSCFFVLLILFVVVFKFCVAYIL